MVFCNFLITWDGNGIVFPYLQLDSFSVYPKWS